MKHFILFFGLAFLSLTACNDACDDITCQNSAACDDGTCLCTEGYEGTLCETKMNAKFVGLYAGLYNCESDSDSTALTVVAGATANEITIRLDDVNFNAIVNGTSFIIPAQTASGQESTITFFETTGDIMNSTIKFPMDFEEDGERNMCFVQAEKQ